MREGKGGEGEEREGGRRERKGEIEGEREEREREGGREGEEGKRGGGRGGLISTHWFGLSCTHHSLVPLQLLVGLPQ